MIKHRQLLHLRQITSHISIRRLDRQVSYTMLPVLFVTEGHLDTITPKPVALSRMCPWHLCTEFRNRLSPVPPVVPCRSRHFPRDPSNCGLGCLRAVIGPRFGQAHLIVFRFLVVSVRTGSARSRSAPPAMRLEDLLRVPWRLLRFSKVVYLTAREIGTCGCGRHWVPKRVPVVWELSIRYLDLAIRYLYRYSRHRL